MFPAPPVVTIIKHHIGQNERDKHETWQHIPLQGRFIQYSEIYKYGIYFHNAVHQLRKIESGQDVTILGCQDVTVAGIVNVSHSQAWHVINDTCPEPEANISKGAQPSLE